MCVEDWKNMTDEQMIIHFFAEHSDAAFQTKGAEIKNSLWYKGGRRNLGKQGLEVRFCKPCVSNNHKEVLCLGPCGNVFAASEATVLNGAFICG